MYNHQYPSLQWICYFYNWMVYKQTFAKRGRHKLYTKIHWEPSKPSSMMANTGFWKVMATLSLYLKFQTWRFFGMYCSYSRGSQKKVTWIGGWIVGKYQLLSEKVVLKHVRCNLDVCPELMSRNQRIVQRGWLILIPHEDKIDVISPSNILFWGGGEFWSLMKIKLMLLVRSAYCE